MRPRLAGLPSGAFRPEADGLFRWCPDWVLVAAVAVASAGWALAWPTTSQDEFSLLIYPDLLGQGRVPNGDFFTPYGPGMYWALAGAYWVTGGPDVVTERLVGAAYHAFLAVGMWSLTRVHGRTLAVTAGLSAAVITGGVQLIAYGWLLGIGFVLWAMVAHNAGHSFLAGALSAAAVTVRPEFVVASVAVFAVLLTTKRESSRHALGFMLAVVPLAVHIWLTEGALLRNVFIDRVSVDARVGVPDGAIDLWLGVGLVAASAMVLAARATFVRRRPASALAVLAVVLFPQVFQRTDREHLIFVGAVVVPLAFVEVGAAVRAKRTSLTSTLLSRGLASLALGLLAFMIVFSSWLAPRGLLLEVNGRRLYVADAATHQGVKRMIESLERNLKPGDKVLVGPRDLSRAAVTANYIYYILPGRVPQAYFLEFAPGVTETAGSPLVGDVKAADVLLLSEFPASRSEQLFPYLQAGTQQVNSYVDDYFCPRLEVAGVGVFPDITLMRRCADGL